MGVCDIPSLIVNARSCWKSFQFWSVGSISLLLFLALRFRHSSCSVNTALFISILMWLSRFLLPLLNLLIPCIIDFKHSKRFSSFSPISISFCSRVSSLSDALLAWSSSAQLLFLPVVFMDSVVMGSTIQLLRSLADYARWSAYSPPTAMTMNVVWLTSSSLNKPEMSHFFCGRWKISMFIHLSLIQEGNFFILLYPLSIFFF